MTESVWRRASSHASEAFEVGADHCHCPAASQENAVWSRNTRTWTGLTQAPPNALRCRGNQIGSDLVTGDGPRPCQGSCGSDGV